MSNEPSTGDYAMSSAHEALDKIKALEKRLEIMEAICRVCIVADPEKVYEAIHTIRLDRDAAAKAELDRKVAILNAEDPEGYGNYKSMRNSMREMNRGFSGRIF